MGRIAIAIVAALMVAGCQKWDGRDPIFKRSEIVRDCGPFWVYRHEGRLYIGNGYQSSMPLAADAKPEDWCAQQVFQ
jgi:hypothetical protein